MADVVHRVRAVLVDPLVGPSFVDVRPWPSLSDIQRCVRGYVEPVYPGPRVGWHIYVAERARDRGMPYNALATDLVSQASSAFHQPPQLYGPVLVVGTRSDGIDTSAPPDVLKRIGLT